MNIQLYFVCMLISVKCVRGIIIKQYCSQNEIYKPCVKYPEYTCWTSNNREERNLRRPTRLAHCKSGCYCKYLFVRSFPGGRCIGSMSCRDKKVNEIMKIPDEFNNF